jgi:hypothetical protein
VLAPARTRGPELETVIAKLFSVFGVYTGDEAKTRAQMAVWTEELQEFPLYAIRKAYKWAVRIEHRLPPLAKFIGDVREAIGGKVVQRKKLLLELSSGQV